MKITVVVVVVRDKTSVILLAKSWRWGCIQRRGHGKRLSQGRYKGGAGAFDKFFTFFCPRGFTAGAKLRIMRAIAGA